MQITMNNNCNPAYERMFDNLIREVFGFSFAPWLERKLWDEQYESFSIIQDGIMLSNVCIYKTDMLVHGQSFRAHQFGAIATRESERGKGFSRRLMEYVLSLYPDTPAFLYANPSVVDFYPRFGFRQVHTFRPQLTIAINNSPDKAVKYGVDSDLIRNALYDKRIYSSIADNMNTQSIQIFHLLMDYADGIYQLPDCGAIVIAEQNGGKLFLADVITQKPISIDELVKELPFSGIEVVEFGFCPEWLDVNPRWEQVDWGKEPFFVKGDWNLPDAFRFPSMSAT